jgi:hypothetical protein
MGRKFRQKKFSRRPQKGSIPEWENIEAPELETAIPAWSCQGSNEVVCAVLAAACHRRELPMAEKWAELPAVKNPEGSGSCNTSTKDGPSLQPLQLPANGA